MPLAAIPAAIWEASASAAVAVAATSVARLPAKFAPHGVLMSCRSWAATARSSTTAIAFAGTKYGSVVASSDGLKLERDMPVAAAGAPTLCIKVSVGAVVILANWYLFHNDDVIK